MKDFVDNIEANVKSIRTESKNNSEVITNVDKTLKIVLLKILREYELDRVNSKSKHSEQQIEERVCREIEVRAVKAGGMPPPYGNQLADTTFVNLMIDGVDEENTGVVMSKLKIMTKEKLSKKFEISNIKSINEKENF